MNRPRRKDGEATRQKIIETAGELIARNGYAGTSNKAIAQAAGVDMAAINYHFGGREGLYLSVLSEAHRHFVDGAELQALAESQQAPVDKFSAFIDMLVMKLKGMAGWYSQVFFRELFSPSVELNAFVEFEGSKKIASIRQIMSEVSGLPENDPRLLLCTLNVVAPCLMLIVSAGRVPGPVSTIYSMEKEQLAEHFKRFALGGLKAVVD
ncbi:TetR/AcrR family transcriptional regulator [Klebsiella quasipneumoniae]|uniref:TetR/AcrR family transcriptional regulator n=1 Tax=Klebsiella quasipneumoniae TaxID=1463165 RepID=UPI0022E65095|nr:TetR/AcrR family transcriptional regulator [Klebsiella quasipneumoniae]